MTTVPLYNADGLVMCDSCGKFHDAVRTIVLGTYDGDMYDFSVCETDAFIMALTAEKEYAFRGQRVRYDEYYIDDEPIVKKGPASFVPVSKLLYSKGGWLPPSHPVRLIQQGIMSIDEVRARVGLQPWNLPETR
jgi:hypothetical protein